MEKRPDSAECSCNSPEMLLRRFSDRVDSVLVRAHSGPPRALAGMQEVEPERAIKYSYDAV